MPKCEVCGDELSEFPIMNDDGRNGYTFVCENCEHHSQRDVTMKKKCPYGIDCIPDEACKNCRGMVKCPRCGKESLIPKSRNICYACWRTAFS